MKAESRFGNAISILACLVLIAFTQELKAQAKLDFSQKRGFSDSPFNLTITPEDPTAIIRYTLDGEEPSTTSGQIYNGSISIETTTVLRAIGYVIGVDTSKIYTHTYLFIDDVVNQPENISGWPNSTYDIGNGNATAVHDYEMDPAIVMDPLYQNDIIDGLKDIPSMSIVMPKDDFWDVNDGDFEKKTSIELLYFHDPTENEQEDGGIEPHSHNRLKRSFRLSFKNIYGAGDWDSDIFQNAVVGGESAKDEFDRIVLRAGNNRAWSRNWNTDRTAFTRDEWFRQSQIAASGIGSHGTFVHLYINGLYWGLYNPVERPDESFTSTYLGGEKEDWFAVSHGGDQGGNDDRYDYLKNTLLNKDLTNSTNYEELKTYLDIDQFSDYVLLSWMTGVQDWPGNNWWGGNRNNPAEPFMFFGWDNEWSWDVTKNANNGAWVHPAFESNDTGGQNSALVFNKAKVNDDFMMSFADRVYKLCYNDGVMTDANSRERWSDLNDNIENAVVAESARWGDGIDDGVTRTRDIHWQDEVDRLDGLMDGNVQRLMDALLAEDYYPSIDPPLFENNGNTLEVQELLVLNNYNIDLVNPNGVGQIYYSTDGVDPRLPGGAISSTATAYSNQNIIINGSTSLLARLKNGNEWSALHCLNLIVEQDLSAIKLTEIMYNPGDLGTVLGSELEFLEIKNTSTSLSLDIGGLQIADGVDYTFPVGTIMEPQSFLVLASNAEELANKCPDVNVFGEYQGQLSNGGEQIELVTFAGDTIVRVTYDDKSPWPIEADGLGHSLVSSEFDPVGSQDDYSLWMLSTDNFCGSPEANDCALTGQSCDDGNDCTTNDVYTENCLCEGTLATSEEAVVLNPSDDAYLQGSTAFNTEELRIEEGNRITYMKFDLTSIPTTMISANLLLNVGGDEGTGTIEVFLGSNNNWTETTLTSSNAPLGLSSLASINTTYNSNQTHTWNLDVSQFSNTIISLVVMHSNGNDVAFKSKENSDSDNIPKLEITYEGEGVQEGDSCDDNNTNTYDDVYTDSCICEGKEYSTIGNYVWLDYNHDGIQNNSESGVSSILIELYNDQDEFQSSTLTNESGEYTFENIVSGDYYIKVNLGFSSYSFTDYAQGFNLTIDSDIDESNGPGTSPLINLDEESEDGIDVGLLFGVVPVVWREFDGRNKGDYNELNWITEMEINVRHFVIERSLDSSPDNFIEIGQKVALTNSTSENIYYFEDHELEEKGLYYYRIKEVENDGAYSYSPSISINVENERSKSISLYPNPVSDKLDINFSLRNDGNVEWGIWDVTGKTLSSKSENEDLISGTYSKQIDVKNLRSGLYILKFRIGNKIYNKKFIKVD